MLSNDFLALLDRTLSDLEVALEAATDAIEVDIDIERTANVLTLTFPNGSKIIINGQEPLQEIWVAARGAGSHFKRQDNQWRDTKNGQELFAAIGAHASHQTGVNLSITTPKKAHS